MSKQLPEVVSEVIWRRSNHTVLRPPLRSDVPCLVRWMNDPEVTRYLVTAHFPMMEADEEAWVEQMHKRKPHNFSVVIAVNSAPIGTMGLHNISLRDRTAVTGTVIGEKSCWGKGYAPEAKMLLLDYAFNTLDLRKVFSSVIAANSRSYRYNSKCGYREEGRLKEKFYRNGRYLDEILLSVTRADWEPLWGQFAKEHGITVS